MGSCPSKNCTITPLSLSNCVFVKSPSLLKASSLSYVINLVSKKSHSGKSQTSICNCICTQYSFFGIPFNFLSETGFFISNNLPYRLFVFLMLIPSGEAPKK